ncbi:MAG: hypothetical protein H0W46_10275 [Acidimicrobiia bacterium]|nr:hypothetical protein [Acidimicrobiia bacterium]
MKRRRVLVDSSFVDDLVDPAARDHDDARRVFEQLIGEYEIGRTVLFSLAPGADSVGDSRRAAVLRVCDVVQPRRWLTREGGRVVREHPETGQGRATSLVLMRRLGIGEIATFDGFFADHGIPTVPGRGNCHPNEQQPDTNGETFAKRSGRGTAN